MAEMKAEAIVDALADTQAEVETETLSDTLFKVRAEALVHAFGRHASRSGGRKPK